MTPEELAEGSLGVGQRGASLEKLQQGGGNQRPSVPLQISPLPGVRQGPAREGVGQHPLPRGPLRRQAG